MLVNGKVMQVSMGNQFAITKESLFSILAETRMVILEVRIGVTEEKDNILFEEEDWNVILKSAGSSNV
ncbi:hypothetical protein D3C74_500400 [compost metagenome]